MPQIGLFNRHPATLSTALPPAAKHQQCPNFCNFVPNSAQFSPSHYTWTDSLRCLKVRQPPASSNLAPRPSKAFLNPTIRHSYCNLEWLLVSILRLYFPQSLHSVAEFSCSIYRANWCLVIFGVVLRKCPNLWCNLLQNWRHIDLNPLWGDLWESHR